MTGDKSCPLCTALEDKDTHIVYEDELVVGVLVAKGFMPGHIQVFPKRHIGFLDDMTEDELKNSMKVQYSSG